LRAEYASSRFLKRKSTLGPKQSNITAIPVTMPKLV
jgi:hypothetical protein